MEEISPESLEYLKRHVPGFTEFLATPDDQKDSYLVRKINEKNLEYGLAPIDRLLTPEEAYAAAQQALHPQVKNNWRHRLRRAWAILWPQDN